jgi:uncharacterized protein YcbK (DUF882 family)
MTFAKAVLLGSTFAVCMLPGLALSETPSKGAAAAKAPPRTASLQHATKSKAPSGPIQASLGWHALPAAKEAPLDSHGRARLVLQGLNIPDRIELTARTDSGDFDAADLDHAAHIMRDRSGNEHPIDPRLLDTVYRLQVRFHAPEIRIISGYRTPRNGGTSNHGRGRAMDLVVPGASDEEVARFARERGFTGVGIYPLSGFVHVDVRERSYFWVDTSGPGKRSRIRGILGDQAARSDIQATARGERGVDPFHISTNVDASVGVNAASPQVQPADEEDEADGD